MQIKFISGITGFVVDLLHSSSILIGEKKKKVMCAVLNNSLYTQKTWGANGGKACVQLITEFGFNCTWKKLGIPYSLYAIIMHAISKKPGIFITHSTMWNPQHRQAKSLPFISTYCEESWIQGMWC